MIYLLLIPGAVLLGLIFCIPMFCAAKSENNHGFPYPPSKEFLEKYEEEQKIRQEIAREHGIETLNAYLDINRPRKK